MSDHEGWREIGVDAAESVVDDIIVAVADVLGQCFHLFWFQQLIVSIFQPLASSRGWIVIEDCSVWFVCVES